jgi:hypothetical protein
VAIGGGSRLGHQEDTPEEDVDREILCQWEFADSQRLSDVHDLPQKKVTRYGPHQPSYVEDG